MNETVYYVIYCFFLFFKYDVIMSFVYIVKINRCMFDITAFKSSSGFYYIQVCCLLFKQSTIAAADIFACLSYMV